MTYKVVKFSTSKGAVPGLYEVAFCGDDRFYQKLEVHVSQDLGPDALDYVELFGIWFYIMAIGSAGMNRTAKGLSLVVSRGAIKKLLRTDSSKAHLFSYTNAIRTQLYGLKAITVEKNAAWASGLEVVTCAKWNGEPPEYPEVENPVLGKVGITYHALQRYYEHTNSEGRQDLVFNKVQKLAREATIEARLDARTIKHKELKYGDASETTRYLNTPSGWQAVIVSRPGVQQVLTTVYQRNGY